MSCCCSSCCGGAFREDTIVIGNSYSQPIFAMAKQMKVYEVKRSLPLCGSCCSCCKPNTEFSKGWDVVSQLKKDGLTVKVITSASEVAQGSFTLSGQAKINLDETLIKNGFARINPGEKLEFGSTNMRLKGDVYITITTNGKDGEDDKDKTLVLCHNYIPPSWKTVMVSPSGSITLVDKREINGWQPKTHVVPNAGPNMAKRMEVGGTVQPDEMVQQAE